MSAFESFKLSPNLMRALGELGFTEPTAIQAEGIPIIKSGKDIIGIAQTGTGKTAAYALPILQKLRKAEGLNARALVLVPTKELVLQVKSQIHELSSYTNLRVAGLYGGVGPGEQIAELSEGVDIIVATPGRFMDLYFRETIATKQIRFLVLDEADRMMDMGFMPQIRAMLEVIPSKRQNLLFSATFPEKVESLSQEFLDFPERIEVSRQATTVETIAQSAVQLDNFMRKLTYLESMLDDASLERVILFTRTREVAENLSRFLIRKVDPNTKVIHSNKGQNSRINAMEAFRNGEVRILVSTDVSARGIDVPEVSHVINFTVPHTYEDYVHRVGRTGRAKQKGEAITFVDRSEIYHLQQIEELIGQKIPLAPQPEYLLSIPTEKEEKQEQAREIDRQKVLADPTYKGAFHERKKKFKPKAKGNTFNPAKKSINKKVKRRK